MVEEAVVAEGTTQQTEDDNGFFSAKVWNNFTNKEQQHIWDLQDARLARQVAALSTILPSNTVNDNGNGNGNGTTNANSGNTINLRQQPQR